jgi:hypothetical protein
MPVSDLSEIKSTLNLVRVAIRLQNYQLQSENVTNISYINIVRTFVLYDDSGISLQCWVYGTNRCFNTF